MTRQPHQRQHLPNAGRRGNRVNARKTLLMLGYGFGAAKSPSPQVQKSFCFFFRNCPGRVEATQPIENIYGDFGFRSGFDTQTAEKGTVCVGNVMACAPRVESFEAVSVLTPTWAVTFFLQKKKGLPFTRIPNAGPLIYFPPPPQPPIHCRKPRTRPTPRPSFCVGEPFGAASGTRPARHFFLG